MPLKMLYESAKTRAEPYAKIAEKFPQVRRDTVQPIKENRKAYVLAHNRE